MAGAERDTYLSVFCVPQEERRTERRRASGKPRGDNAHCASAIDGDMVCWGTRGQRDVSARLLDTYDQAMCHVFALWWERGLARDPECLGMLGRAVRLPGMWVCARRRHASLGLGTDGGRGHEEQALSRIGECAWRKTSSGV